MAYLSELNNIRRQIEADPAVTFTAHGDFTTVTAPPELERELRWLMSERGVVLNQRQHDGHRVVLTFFRLM